MAVDKTNKEIPKKNCIEFLFQFTVETKMNTCEKKNAGRLSKVFVDYVFDLFCLTNRHRLII